MNCKQGELAVVKYSSATLTPGLTNRFVTTVRLAVAGETFPVLDPRGAVKRLRWNPNVVLGPAWVVTASTPLPWLVAEGVFKGHVFHLKERVIPDSVLRPIRDQPGEDEMLRIAGKPKDLAMPDRAVGRDRFADLIRRVTS